MIKSITLRNIATYDGNGILIKAVSYTHLTLPTKA